ncbi:aspartate ammonia-lyase [Desulfobaculum bizertense]|uniref:Aspartate ammonia-lyase n=1 Tax=Desulfobaculum bizertense DSM 18034 TaxID=1121442 RepID=A0A1T4WLB4_9BACT|nr:aspartate ammonia-lyase [Desulfobaculum bizertense]UIJ37133.1 aspartate ammonia-lyase [Desulfobaculum bizertense]SKA77431.1 aspartate ammonia-lyase [Desulfobaculum bizertense DSM 18034]
MKTRKEHDFLGEREIPSDIYYGVQTLRAVENFTITGTQISSCPEMINALAYVKKAAAMANMELGILSSETGKAICGACDEIISGKLHEQFPVDCIQGGAGTSTNMNANEVIANRALELMGHEKGEYKYCHPNNHVNCSQSTNDAYPTAFRLALYTKLGTLIEAMEYLQKGFAAKGAEFADVLKMGRTQLQDAVPMTLGQEFSAYATTLGEDIKRVCEARKLLTEINLGATAIGTGINAPDEYSRIATAALKNMTGIDFETSENLVEATWDTGAYVQVSGVMKRVAVKLSKICSDLRLLSSGPRTGLNEINLPKMQPGSSIMPGKVNPVIPEVVNQVAYDIIGKDVTVTMASENGQLELNVMEPVIANALFNGVDMLHRACRVLQDRCVQGITANRERCRQLVENSIGIITALNPIIGYEKSAGVAKEALETGGSVYELVLNHKILDKSKLDEILSAENMMHPRFIRN